MSALSDYITATRRLLRDANANFFSDAELTDAVNAGRNKVALDCGCLRSLEAVTLTINVETYTLSAMTSKTTRAIDLHNLIVIWGQTRVHLDWRPWSVFNAYFRTWVTNTSRPCVWSNFGVGTSTVVYVQPVPNQTYSAFADIFYIPAALIDGSSTDELSYPFSDCVPYYAASQAKFKQQNFGEATLYEQQYKQKAAWAISVGYTSRVPSMYDNRWP